MRGPIGSAIDVLAVIATVTGVAATLGLVLYKLMKVFTTCLKYRVISAHKSSLLLLQLFYLVGLHGPN